MNTALIIFTFLLTVYANTHYIISIFQGKTKPHIYSWLIWSIVNAVVFIIQIQNWAGWWAMVLWIWFIINVSVTILSIKYGERNITLTDTLSFIITLCIIPLWLIAKLELVTIVLASMIDALSFYPTIRKSYREPGEENIFPYVASGIWYTLSILLVANINGITIFYPLFVSVINFLFIGYIYWRRKVIKQ